MAWTPETAYPLPPQNAHASVPYQQGVIDLRWDDPYTVKANTAWSIIGVNIYRATASDRGPYFRINEFPIGATFYRDRTDIVLVDREPIDWNTSWITKGDVGNRWQFQTQSRIYKRDLSMAQPDFANASTDVTVYINGEEVSPSAVFGRDASVTLLNVRGVNLLSGYNTAETHPLTEDDLVEVTYWTLANHVADQTWYRISTVAVVEGGFEETPLNECRPCTKLEVESMDYIWSEAVRRNQWILQQGGEQVNFFVRKVAGVVCDCKQDTRTLEFTKQPSSTCEFCYGVGIVGGYEGPYGGVMAPDDGETRWQQTRFGRQKSHMYEVFTGPSPVLTQRDFIVTQTNERYSIGPVRRPSNRGNLLQQHFSVNSLDDSDIRYRVSLDGTDSFAWPQTRDLNVVMPRMPVDGKASLDQEEGWGSIPATGDWPLGPDPIAPMQTDKPGVDVAIQKRGRTRPWENISHQ